MDPGVSWHVWTWVGRRREFRGHSMLGADMTSTFCTVNTKSDSDPACKNCCETDITLCFRTIIKQTTKKERTIAKKNVGKPVLCLLYYLGMRRKNRRDFHTVQFHTHVWLVSNDAFKQDVANGHPLTQRGEHLEHVLVDGPLRFSCQVRHTEEVGWDDHRPRVTEHHHLLPVVVRRALHLVKRKQCETWQFETEQCETWKRQM